MRVKYPVILIAVSSIGVSLPARSADYNTGPAATISCPSKGARVKVHDLSTGLAPWVVTGPNLPNGGITRATPIDTNSLPAGWTARLSGAQWVQAVPANRLTPHAAGEYVFTLTVQIKKAKRMPRLVLTADFVGDEGYDLTLIEPPTSTEHIGSGGGMGTDDTPYDVSQDDVMRLILNKSADGSGKPLGHRAGIYQLRIAVMNSDELNSGTALLARVKLEAVCGGRK
jgi:hypothetical protein